MYHGGPVLLELLANITDVRLDHVAISVEVVVPDVIENLRLGNNVSRIEQEVPQQREFSSGEMYDIAGTADLMRFFI